MSQLPSSLAAALAKLDRPGCVELTIRPGDEDAPCRWARSVFGDDCRPDLSRAGSSTGRVRPNECEATLSLDLCWPERRLLAILERALAAGAVARVSRVTELTLGELHYNVYLRVPIRTSHPMELVPVFETVRASAVTKQHELRACRACGASHQVEDKPNRPYEHDPPSTVVERCRRCWDATIEITFTEGYTVRLVIEDDP